ncbi:MAG: hypothetical protein DRO13_00620 [Thermoprotei archaeon]|nr:MAG: hypothetical protein DRO13_00620 [Thermoprotei archaeon]
MSKRIEEEKTVLIRYNIVSASLLGFGGSLYVALETMIGLTRYGYTVFFQTGLPKTQTYKFLMDALKYYGLETHAVNSKLLLDSNDRCVSVNVSGDVLSGPAHIIYFHYPVLNSPTTYYPFIHPLYKPFAELYHYANKALNKVLLKNMILPLANSSFTSKLIQKTLGIKPRIVYPPVKVEEFYSKPVVPLEEREKIVLIVSRISYEKYPHRVIHLAKALRDLGLTDWKVVWVGSSSKLSKRVIGEVYELSSLLGLREYIEFKPDVSRRELIDLYRNSYVYVHLTEKEHFGISIVEAMAAGTPVVIPRSSGAWIDIAGGSKYLALPYSNYLELKNRIKELARDRSLWKELSLNARNRAWIFRRDRFHREISKYVDIVRNIVNGMK